MDFEDAGPLDSWRVWRSLRHALFDVDDIRTHEVYALTEVEAARKATARSVNSLMTATYWEIGRRIVA